MPFTCSVALVELNGSDGGVNSEVYTAESVTLKS